MRVQDANIQRQFAPTGDTQTHLDRTTGIASPSLAYDLHNLIEGLKTDGIWSKIAILCVVHDTEADSLLNLKGNGTDNDSAKVGSPTFVADRGFTMVSSGANYISLQETETTMSQYVAGSGHAFCYQRTMIASSWLIAMATSVTRSRLSTIGGDFRLIDIQGAGSGSSGLVLSSTAAGFIGATINGSADRYHMNNDTRNQDSVSDTGTIRTTTCVVGDVNGNGVNGNGTQVAAWGMGAGLTDTEFQNYEDRIQTYMQVRGADVF